MIKQNTMLLPIFLVMAFSIATTDNANAEPPSEAPLEAQGFDALDTIATDALSSLQGRDNLTNVQSIQELDATVSNSSFNADTINTGAITIEQHALDNFEGVGMFNIFTGNNNAVNSAVGISIYITEPN
ncbi:MAG: hypothetical protein ACJAWL_000537 [Motiliproteus sp.]|jgi:hypothetical protein